MLVIKRDGRTVPFDRVKIKEAIAKAFKAVKPDVVTDRIGDNNLSIIDVTDRVVAALKGREKVNIEEIQDLVEETLMERHHHAIAKAYILYREKRAEQRLLASKLVESQEDIEFRELCEKNSVAFGNNPMREFVYMRTYSRWIEDKGRREIWSETVERYVNFLHKHIGEKLTQDDYNEIYSYIFEQKVMPSMRLLQFAGPAAERCNVCVYNCAFSAPTSFKDLADIMYLSMSGTGVGFSAEARNVSKFPEIRPLNGRSFNVTIEDSKEGWCDALQFGLVNWFEGTKVVFDYSLLRPAGARLKTMGGRSSGPGPLMDLMKFTEEIIDKRRTTTKRLSTLDIHDIICKIGQIVVSGGVRRSALIGLSDLSDHDIRDCKTGNFWITNSQRCLANNSAVYDQKPDQITFMKEWLALAQSGTGERGIFNRGGLERVIPQRRVEVVGDKVKEFGMNPCVTASTWIQTVEGPRQVRDLIGKKVDLVINGEPYPMESEGFFYTGDKQVYRLTTKHGHSIELTAEHPVLQHISTSSRGNQTQQWTKLQDLSVGDRVCTSNHRLLKEWPGEGTFAEGWLIGEIVGDGGILKKKDRPGSRNYAAYLRFWGESAEAMKITAVEYTKKYCRTKTDFKGTFNEDSQTWNVRCVGLYELCVKYGITMEKTFTDITEKTSSAFQRGLIRGFFDADGSVQGNIKKGYSIRLGQSELSRLVVIQRMLLRLGIQSTLYQNRRPEHSSSLPDGKGGYKEYDCKPQHELVISNDNIVLYRELIDFHEPAKIAKLKELVESYTRKPNREKFISEIASIEKLDVEPVYDVTVAEVHEFCANGIRLHNCGEILLQPFQFCNLTEVVLRAEDSWHDIQAKVRVATLLGTCQAYFSDFKYIDPKWKENQEAERLLGVSLTGIYDISPLEANQLNELKSLAIKENVRCASALGIRRSTAITVVKPSGTVSQMVDSSSGIHPRFSEYYIRRIRISATDPLLMLMKDQGYPCLPEVGQAEPNVNTYVLEFPVKAPTGSLTVKNVTALEQLDTWLLYKRFYTEHNPSVTIYVKPDEWLAIGKWVWDNWDYVTGLSFLPYSDHVYELAPYEAIDSERYDILCSKIKKVDFSKLRHYEKKDNTDVKKEMACVGGVCEL